MIDKRRVVAEKKIKPKMNNQKQVIANLQKYKFICLQIIENSFRYLRLLRFRYCQFGSFTDHSDIWICSGISMCCSCGGHCIAEQNTYLVEGTRAQRKVTYEKLTTHTTHKTVVMHGVVRKARPGVRPGYFMCRP